MPDIGTEIVSLVNIVLLFGPLNLLNLLLDQLDEEFRYLQRKKNVAKELAEVRLKVCHRCFYNDIEELTCIRTSFSSQTSPNSE
jgi:hypothetical protein